MRVYLDEQSNYTMAIGDVPSFGPSERLLYGLPSKITIDSQTQGCSGAKVAVGPYKRHSYQVSGTNSAVGKFNIYGSNDKNAPLDEYQLIAQYSVSPSSNVGGLMYSDEFLFDYAYCAINPYTGGTFTVIEKHSP